MSPHGTTVRPYLGRTALSGVWLLMTILGLGIACSSFDSGTESATSLPGIATAPAAITGPRAERTPTPAAEPADPPAPVPTTSAVLGATPTSPPSATPAPTRSPTVSPSPGVEAVSLSLDLLAPAEGADVEVGAVRVLGITSPGAVVMVNGIEADVNSDGTFQHDLVLQEGINSVEALAAQPSGAVASDSVVVLFVPRAAGIPLSVLFPQGVEVSEPRITIIGATRQDAVVGVNGVPVDVNSLGIFSTEVALEVGANLVEVVAVDLDENVNFQTVVVFHIPDDGPISIERN